jgi:hypothetical protein
MSVFFCAQSIGMEGLLSRYKAQDSSHKKLRVEAELLNKQRVLQMQRVRYVPGC